ncbi:fumarylacetoacetate hydrolase family protein [Pseudonocardia spinosispora]|uniref:fumarylacetoacetate hydrolase family protein n=1 Tax=Pseudonocardia spinosispora TaxID=103441 RepID=UPI00316AD2D7
MTEAGAVDVEAASGGRFDADPDAVFARWDELREWAEDRPDGDGVPYADEQLGAPVLCPAQIFGIGLNYRDHAAESGVGVPATPAVFTKFASCLTGPYDTVRLPSAGVDWEVELVVVIGRRADDVAEENAWSHVAGLTVGQDLSERALQLAGPVPQFSLGKSYPGFGPLGPSIVTPDELPDPDDLELSCSVNEEVLQKGRTRDMVFSVPELVARLSAVCPLLPGDLIFTGTPPGVGMARIPPRFLSPGTTLVSRIEGVGQLRNPLVAR